MSRPRGSWHKSRSAAPGWFILLALGISWPLILNIGTHVPGGGAGDNVAFLWNFWWFRYALAEPGASLFFTEQLFAPFGTSLVLHTHTALEALVGATILGGTPVLVAHNVVLLAGLAANGALAFALAHHQVRRVLPAVLAGTVFAGSAYISIRLLGHFNLVHAWVLPLAVLAWIRCSERPSLGRGVWVAVAFAAAAYSDYYYLVYALMAAAAWWVLATWKIDIVRARGAGRTAWVSRLLVSLMITIAALIVAILATGGFRFEIGSIGVSATSIRNPLAGLWLLAIVWTALRVRVAAARKPGAASFGQLLPALATALALWCLAVLPLAVPAAGLPVSGDYVSPPTMWRSGPRGIDLLTLVAGNPLNPAYGAATRAAYAHAGIDLIEQTAWLGIVPIVIITIATLGGSLRDPIARPWWVLSTGFLVWALGGYLLVGGIDTGLPMPQMLARFVPVLSNARMPGRAIVMVQLGTAVLCAIAATRFQWRPAAIVALIGVSVADGAAVPIHMYQLPLAGSIESALSSAGSQARIVELPLGLRDGFGELGRFDHRALIFQMSHERPIAGGFVARLSPRVRDAYDEVPALSALIKVSSATDRQAADELPFDLATGLLSAGFTHLVVNIDAMPFALREPLESRGLRLIAAAGTRELYAVGSGS